jgi:hypothetical protein
MSPLELSQRVREQKARQLNNKKTQVLTYRGVRYNGPYPVGHWGTDDAQRDIT